MNTEPKKSGETIDHMKYIIKLEEQAMEERRMKAKEAEKNEPCQKCLIT